MGTCSSKISPESEGDFASMKKSDAVEKFLKLAFIQGDHLTAIHNILSVDNARKQFLEFLRTEYYVGAPLYYEEALNYLDFETAVVKASSLSQRLGLAKSVKSMSVKRQPTEIRNRRSTWTKKEQHRYEQVIQELATIAFPQFVQSKMYARIRAHESGTISSLRARISFDIRSIKEVVSSAVSSNKTIFSVNSYQPLPRHVSSSVLSAQFSQHVSRENSIIELGAGNMIHSSSSYLHDMGGHNLHHDIPGLIVNYNNNSNNNNNSNSNFINNNSSSFASGVVKSLPCISCDTADTAGDQAPPGSASSAPRSAWGAPPPAGSMSPAAGDEEADILGSLKHFTENVALHRIPSAAAPPMASSTSASAVGTTTTTNSANSATEGASDNGYHPVTVGKDAITSFSETAFNCMDSSSEAALLNSSTWITLLVAGMEPCPISFCLVAVTEKRGELPFAYANKNFESDFGYSRNELVGKSYHSIFTKETLSHEPGFSLQRAMVNGMALQFVIDATHGSGLSMQTFVCLKPIFDVNYRYRYMICLFVIRKKPHLSATSKSHENIDESSLDMAFSLARYGLRDMLNVLPDTFAENSVR